MLKKFLSLTLKSIRYRPIRGWLTILGIIIGIMLVVIILSLSSGIKNSIAKTLQMFGSDLIIIRPGKVTNPIESVATLVGGARFRDQDILALANIRGVRFVAPMDIAVVNSEFRGEKKPVMIHGAPWSKYKLIYEESQGLKLHDGRWPENEDINEVVIGHRIAEDLFKNKMRVGEEIILKSKRMKVVGVLSPIGEQMADNVVYASLNMFRQLTGARPGIISAAIKIEPGVNPDLVTKQIEFQLSQQKAVEDFSVLTPEKIGNIIGDVLTIVETVLFVIALISLLVGAVGIMNTMYTAVLERTKQIGVMKAIGASSDSILSLFLIESGMIGLVGGILGIILGVTAAYLVGLIAAQFGIRGLFSFAALDLFGFLVILIITFITGIVSGLLPARQAAQMEPAEALRYE
ncbi:MAG: ABC transporter permease [Candidatus Harrisonbacteria bacterium]|nr:ABC transporter permease [Candidatus Harrisonbacteria bacterium]